MNSFFFFSSELIVNRILIVSIVVNYYYYYYYFYYIIVVVIIIIIIIILPAQGTLVLLFQAPRKSGPLNWESANMNFYFCVSGHYLRAWNRLCSKWCNSRVCRYERVILPSQNNCSPNLQEPDLLQNKFALGR